MSYLEKLAKQLFATPELCHDDLGCCEAPGEWQTHRVWNLVKYEVGRMAPAVLGRIVAEGGTVRFKADSRMEGVAFTVTGLDMVMDMERLTMLELLQDLATSAIIVAMVRIHHPDDLDFQSVVNRTAVYHTHA